LNWKWSKDRVEPFVAQDRDLDELEKPFVEKFRGSHLFAKDRIRVKTSDPEKVASQEPDVTVKMARCGPKIERRPLGRPSE
jgi:hypothetical protein